jgi:hypothetical protein
LKTRKLKKRRVRKLRSPGVRMDSYWMSLKGHSQFFGM